MSEKTICMYGAASDQIDNIYIRETEELGREIARRHYRLIYGGGASGLMGACSRGAAKENGVVIGVVPAFMDEFEELNKHCTRLILTKTMGERKEIMENEADAFIIAPGGIGTFDELFQVLTLIDLNQKKAPIIFFNIEGYYDDLISFLETCIEKGFVRARVRSLFHVCSTPQEALDAIDASIDKI